MEKIFNIAGPCIAGRHYMLPAQDRHPGLKRLIDDGAYFVLHAPRQCGKTTVMQALTDEINARGDRVALYCSVENAQGIEDPSKGLAAIVDQILAAVSVDVKPFGSVTKRALREAIADDGESTQVMSLLKVLSERCGGKPLVVFFDEVDCLSEGTLIGFLRQLRNGRITYRRPGTFPTTIALVGMRNIRDFQARIRPNGESLGSASPFNVITTTTTLRSFTQDEVEKLYAQHMEETGQVFESGVAERAFAYSGGQPYLVNALARWCVDEIHDRHYDEHITLDDMHTAKERIIRERGTHMDSILERMKEPRVRRVVEPVMLGGDIERDALADDVSLVLDLGLLKDEEGVLKPANPMYAEIIGRYLSWGTQQKVRQDVPETPWVKDGGLDMAGLMAAFQQFWRENADEAAVPFHYREAYPQLVLQAFLQRVLNGGGEIIREMALGKKAMDLEVLFRGAKYAVECKKVDFYERSHEKAYDQICGYMDRLGVEEGWLVIFDPDLTRSWGDKIGHDEVAWKGKRIHIVRC